MATKQEIINKIDQIEDAELLDEPGRWISSLLEATVGEKFSEEEVNAVREGYEQYQAGETLSQQEANKLLDAWLKDK